MASVCGRAARRRSPRICLRGSRPSGGRRRAVGRSGSRGRRSPIGIPGGLAGGRRPTRAASRQRPSPPANCPGSTSESGDVGRGKSASRCPAARPGGQASRGRDVGARPRPGRPQVAGQRRRRSARPTRSAAKRPTRPSARVGTGGGLSPSGTSRPSEQAGRAAKHRRRGSSVVIRWSGAPMPVGTGRCPSGAAAKLPSRPSARVGVAAGRGSGVLGVAGSERKRRVVVRLSGRGSWRRRGRGGGRGVGRLTASRSRRVSGLRAVPGPEAAGGRRPAVGLSGRGGRRSGRSLGGEGPGGGS